MFLKDKQLICTEDDEYIPSPTQPPYTKLSPPTPNRWTTNPPLIPEISNHRMKNQNRRVFCSRKIFKVMVMTLSTQPKLFS